MGTILTILGVIVGIAFSIGLHELGHTIPAKLFKVPVSEYFIGFGPKIFSKQIGETEWGVKAIPFGGYTAIVGMFPQPNPETKKCIFGRLWNKTFHKIIDSVHAESTKGLTRENQVRAFYNLTMPKKVAVMVGGTFTNLLLGFLCFLISFSLIGGQTTSKTIEQVVQSSPAATAGLESGDEILKIGEKRIENWSQVVESLSSSKSEVEIVVLRSGEELTIKATPENGKIGISSHLIPTHLSVLESASITWQVVKATVAAIVTIPVSLGKTIVAVATGTEREPGLISIVGLGQAAVSAEEASPTLASKFASVISLIGSLNIGLFVLNLIPLLPLDGGHTVNAFYEGARRGIAKLRKRPRPGPSDLARSMPVAYAVYGLLILMAIILVLADIIQPVKLF